MRIRKVKILNNLIIYYIGTLANKSRSKDVSSRAKKPETIQFKKTKAEYAKQIKTKRGTSMRSTGNSWRTNKQKVKNRTKSIR